MKKIKAVLALVLVACLFVTLFVACAESERTDANANTQSNTQSNNTSSNTEDTTFTPDEDLMFDPEDPTEINFWISDVYANGGDHGERLEARINEITEPEGIHVNLTFLQIGDWSAKVQTSIAGSERIDLMCYSAGNGITALMSNNMAMDITDYLNEYAPETLELMADYIGAYTYDGRIYGVPTLRSYVTNGYICFNQDTLDAMGLTEQAKAIDSWSSLETLMAAINEKKEAGTYVISPGLGIMLPTSGVHMNGDAFSDLEVYDALGDGNGVVYTDSDGKVSLNQETDAYKRACTTAKEWMDKGWLYPEGMIDTTLRAENVLAAGSAVIELCSSEVGVEKTKSGIYGAQALCLQYYTGQVATSTLTSWGIGIPITSEEPEAAAYFLNTLYTNEEIMKLLVNGEEGVDYNLVDGQAQQIDGQFKQGNFILGNNLLTLPLEGNGADFYQKVDGQNKAAETSPYLGFTLDTEELSLVISQISAVTDQYKATLQCGGYTEEMYQEFLDKLDAAGVQDYLAAVQQQLDAWLAAR